MARDLISVRDLDRSRIASLLSRAERIDGMPREDQVDLAPGRVLATLFFEPSTRTRLSFQAAMQRLGGSTIALQEEASSLAKGETVYDTGTVVAEYGDVVVVRSPHEGTARLLAENTDVPVINGGDGANQHPTQTLLDLYTIRQEQGGIDGLSVGMLGDLKYGRTVHSLVHALALFDDVTVRCIAPDAIRLPEEIRDAVDLDIVETDELDIADLDVLYATRIQEERFPDRESYEAVKDAYVLDRDAVRSMRDDASLLHPLPRVGEIDPAVDDLPQARYFAQAGNGVPVRMALVSDLLGVDA